MTDMRIAGELRRIADVLEQIRDRMPDDEKTRAAMRAVEQWDRYVIAILTSGQLTSQMSAEARAVANLADALIVERRRRMKGQSW